MKIKNYNSILILLIISISLLVNTVVCGENHLITNGDKNAQAPKPAKDKAGGKTVEKQKEIKYTINLIKSEVFPKSQELSKTLSKYTKCKIKQGVLNFVKSVDGTKLNVTPINVLLSDTNLILYENENTNSLFNSIRINDISYLTQKYSSANCFDIVLQNNDEEKASQLNVSNISLCSEDKNYKEWVKAITTFKECLWTP